MADKSAFPSKDLAENYGKRSFKTAKKALKVFNLGISKTYEKKHRAAYWFSTPQVFNLRPGIRSTKLYL